ncbi:hypothetical protein [Helicobacter bizzozeronii]|uniref:hypothetical protein n=1 Tax=Helicobacter bizzozeronii TaxID=56877 RepID=UPI000CF17E3E|nr:hypothetical protein [Helicobacter bizzozeronii]
MPLPFILGAAVGAIFGTTAKEMIEKNKASRRRERERLAEHIKHRHFDVVNVSFDTNEAPTKK